MSSRKPTAKAILNNPDLSSQKAYDKLLKYGYITECPTTMTDSTMGALRAFINGQDETYEVFKNVAKSYSSPLGCGLTRCEWIEKTCTGF